ncbi:DUF167 domain-containing protein [Magnetospirillum sp. 15-1]|uniref:DUF167 domain-containing protein n=1 Tax=Magnetospirillum sp. 15-1 TaxID=1979370 RepID=UPI0018D53311|nr:DUF167 domain-containing protein [Magnetospirillum sp. 15-1]
MARPTDLRDIPDLTPDEAAQQSGFRIGILEADIVFWQNLADCRVLPEGPIAGWQGARMRRNSGAESHMKRPRAKPGSIADENATFFWWEDDTLVINVLGKPSASRDAIGKPKGAQLNISVTAAPRLGRATDHMVRFLAAEFGVSPSAIEVVFGRFNVNKQLRVKAPTKLPAVFQQATLL